MLRSRAVLRSVLRAQPAAAVRAASRASVHLRKSNFHTRSQLKSSAPDKAQESKDAAKPAAASSAANDFNGLFARVLPLLSAQLAKGSDSPVFRCPPLEQADSELKLSLPLEGSASVDQIASVVEQALKYTPAAGHPRLFDRPWRAPHATAQLGDLVNTVLSADLSAYQDAPALQLMEKALIRRMAQMAFALPDDAAAVAGAGAGAGSSSGAVAVSGGTGGADGVFCSSATVANIMAMAVARHKRFPHVKAAGHYPLDLPAVLVPKHAHRSFHQAAMLLGLGLDSVIPVECTPSGQLDIEELERAIRLCVDPRAGEARRNLFMIVATAGTTGLGSFDNLELVSRLAKHYTSSHSSAIHVHVDAAWGGNVLFSDKHKNLLEGLEKADSITWSPSTLLPVGSPCSTLLVRDGRSLPAAFSTSPAADFAAEPEHAFFSAFRGLQGSRRPDSFKMYLAWQWFGSKGFGRLVDETFERAQALKQLIKKDTRFELVLSERKAGSSSGGSSGGSGASGASAGAASAFAAPSFSGAPADTFAVSFWYLPEAIRYGVKRGDRKPGDPAFKVNLIKLIPAIYSKLVADGNMAVNLVVPPEHSLPPHFRVVTSNPRATAADFSALLNEIDRVGTLLAKDLL